MYTILVNQDNTLITTVKERIMQRSSMMDKLRFLVDPLYKGKDISDFTVNLEYILPVSKKYKTEILTLSEELYKDKLEYKLPFDTGLTAEPGEIELQLTFLNNEMDEEGNVTQYVRKTSPTSITIVPISAWSDIVPDEAFSSIDRMLLKVDSQIKELEDAGMVLVGNKADNITLTEDVTVDEDGNETRKKFIQLTSNKEPIGDKVGLAEIVSAGNDELVKEDSDGLFEVVEF